MLPSLVFKVTSAPTARLVAMLKKNDSHYICVWIFDPPIGETRCVMTLDTIARRDNDRLTKNPVIIILHQVLYVLPICLQNLLRQDCGISD
jgi:hypothetical protein